MSLCVIVITIKNYTQYQLYVFLSSLQIGIVNRNRNMQLQLIALLAATFTYSCYLRYLRLLPK